jgi:NACalpha-BTF3-like transcription factor
VGGMTSAERKARKAFESLGLVEQPGFKRVMINYARHGALAIDRPSVHRLPGTDYWVVFGVALPADYSRSSEMARQFSLQSAAAAAAGEAPEAAEAADDAAAPASSVSASTAASAEEDVDLSGLPEGIVAKDVDFVANHAGVTRKQAVEALKIHKSVVPAAMSFSEASA